MPFSTSTRPLLPLRCASKQGILHRTRIMSTQVLADSESCRCTFASGAYQLFRAAGAYIPRGKDTLSARLEVNTRHDKALRIYFHDIFERFEIGRASCRERV